MFFKQTHLRQTRPTGTACHVAAYLGTFYPGLEGERRLGYHGCRADLRRPGAAVPPVGAVRGLDSSLEGSFILYHLEFNFGPEWYSISAKVTPEFSGAHRAGNVDAVDIQGLFSGRSLSTFPCNGGGSELRKF